MTFAICISVKKLIRITLKGTAMMAKYAKVSMLVSLVTLFLFGTAFATYIDFRVPGPDPDNDHRVASGYLINQGGVTLTIASAGPEDLWWDDKDGFGIWGDEYENDEIEDEEIMIISFSSTVYVSYFDLTDLFIEGTDPYAEEGSWFSPGLGSTSFSQNDSTVTNGEYKLDINAYIDEIWFSAPGKINGEDHEFSIAGVAVPEPPTLILLGCGLIVFAGLGRNRLKRK